MRVEELIELLERCHPKAIVMAWDGDSGNMEEVTSLTYNAAEVIIHTDDIS